MIIYHGSNKVIKEPIFGKGKVYNDYGLGFYCTESNELAKEWACNKDSDGYSNKYELDLSGLKVLNLNDKKYSILYWLTLLIQYRNFEIRSDLIRLSKEFLIENYSIDISEYDVIIGYRADDSYFTFAQDFLSNRISLRKLEKAMKLGKLGEQVVLKSKKAFENIKFLDVEIANRNIYFALRNVRDLASRKDYFELREEVNLDDIFIMDLIRGINYEI